MLGRKKADLRLVCYTADDGERLIKAIIPPEFRSQALNALEELDNQSPSMIGGGWHFQLEDRAPRWEDDETSAVVLVLASACVKRLGGMFERLLDDVREATFTRTVIYLGDKQLPSKNT